MPSKANLLGTFTYAYDGVNNRLATVTDPNAQTSTYSYYGALRLIRIGGQVRDGRLGSLTVE